MINQSAITQQQLFLQRRNVNVTQSKRAIVRAEPYERPFVDALSGGKDATK